MTAKRHRPGSKTTPGATSRSEDPRFSALCRAMAKDARYAHAVAERARGLRITGARRFGASGLRVKGKIFAMMTRGTLVVKLPADRVAVLIAVGAGVAYEPRRGRLMKEWIALSGDTRHWLRLVREAHDFVNEGLRPTRTTARG